MFEVPLSEDVFNRFLQCTHRYGEFADTPAYQFELWTEDVRLTSMSKSTLLVYTVDRESVSNTSLLPDGLES